MQIIHVERLCGKHCLSPEDGESVFKAAAEAFEAGEKALLDFAGVETLTSSFLNTAVGRLFGRFDHDVVDRNMAWRGLDQQDERVMRLVVQNAKEYFQKTEDQRRLAGQIAEQALGE